MRDGHKGYFSAEPEMVIYIIVLEQSNSFTIQNNDTYFSVILVFFHLLRGYMYIFLVLVNIKKHIWLIC